MSALLRELIDLARLAPTSANGQPMRVVFVTPPGVRRGVPDRLIG